MYRFLLFLFLAFSCTQIIAQETYTLTGTIYNDDGQAVPFASLYVKGTRLSTVANINGVFKFNLPGGSYTIIFKYVGYRSKEIDVNVTASHHITFTVEEEKYLLKEVNVKADNNPANNIVQRLIDQRKYRRANPTYQCDVYTKGVQRLLDAPKRLVTSRVAKSLKLDSNRRGILYLSETKSKLFFRYPKVKEIMLASKVSGDNQGFSFNRALDLRVNFYENTLHWDALGNQHFVSPLAGNAFRYYRYELLGASTEKGVEVEKIKVIPRSKYSPTFQGVIYVLKGKSELCGLDLTLTEHARINFVDTLRFIQHYSLVDNKHWLPSDITISFSGKVLGFDFNGYYTSLYSNYNTVPDFPEGLFNEEIMQIGPGVNKFSSKWWETERPLPLTPEEERNYDLWDKKKATNKPDTAETLYVKPSNKLKLSRLLTVGQRFEYDDGTRYWYIYPLHKMLFYNTVEGWGVNARVRLVKELGQRRFFEAEPVIRYGFGNKILSANTEFTYRSDSIKHFSITMRGGSDFLDLNSRGTINLFYNTLTTLFEGRNYLKLYRAKFISFSGKAELATGLKASVGVEFARRFPFQNASNTAIFDKTKENLTSNNPVNPNSDEALFPVNNSLSIETKISYTFGQQYVSRPDGKIYEQARYPTLMLNYRRGIPGLLNSAVNYDFFSADIFQDKINMGLWGFSAFYLSAGKFTNAKSLYFSDYHHFTGNQTAIYNPLFPNFHFLDFYAYSTDKAYFEAHYEHNFSGKLMRHIPLLRRLKLEEIVGGAYLNQSYKDYKEFYFGLQRLMFRADFGFGWTPGKPVYKAFRIFYGF